MVTNVDCEELAQVFQVLFAGIVDFGTFYLSNGLEGGPRSHFPTSIPGSICASERRRESRRHLCNSFVRKCKLQS